jgi:multidrug efflux pump
MISRFFIDRPIFAAVLSIVIALAGSIAVFFLPIAQYPPITPPSVQVAISYPGASAQVVSDTVGAPIEQQVNGVEGMLYMSSQMGNDGSYTLTVTFDIGTDLNTALIMVQNRVTLALPQLPNSVQNQGITIKKKTPDLLMIVTFTSPDHRYDDLYLSNFATIYVRDELLRLEGVSDITYMGERDYSIRAWLDPQKLAARNMTASDVAKAVQTQNLATALGQIGEPPTRSDQSSQLPVDTLGRLVDPEQFGAIIVKVERGDTPPAFALDGSTSRGGGTGPPSSGIPSLSQMGGADGTSGGTPSTGSSSSGTTTSTQSGSGPASLGAGASTPSMGQTVTKTNNVVSGFVQFNIQAPGLGGTGITTTTGTGTGAATPVTSTGAATGAATTSGAAANAGTTGGGTGQTANALAPPAGQGGTTATQSATGSMGQTTVSKPPRPSTAIVRLRDVARVELAALNYTQSCTFDGGPSVGLGVRQLPGTNALDIAVGVARKLEELKSRFPDGIEYQIPYDTTPFIRESVAEVVQTLVEAVILVGLVVLAFLQNWRAALIPLVAVPVAIVGTFAVMAALGFSLNNISLFGLVLAIGIVVDDAIVVVENVERWLEQGLDPREATRKAMDEVTGPVIAVALVLCAVFVPCAFIGGITGQFFRQFAVTIAVSTVISAFNSLTLSPALAAILLQPHGARRDPLTWLLQTLFGWFFRLFNRVFDAGTAGYSWVVGRLLHISFVVLLAYGGLVVLTYFVFSRAPTGFIPQQDQGRLIVGIQLPDSASLQRTEEALAQIEKITRATPGVAHTITISGMSFVLSATGSNFASMFVILDPFAERRSPDRRDTAIMAVLRKEWVRQIKDADVTVFGAPPIPGLSVAGGFKLMVEDRGGLGLASLEQKTNQLVRKLRENNGLTGVSTQFRSNTPQLYMDIDRVKAEALGVNLGDVNQTLQIYLGSLYVNSYNDYGRYWQVTLQADGPYRARIDNINLLKVRNKWGGMVPLGTIVNVREVGGPVFVTRYNLSIAAPITGNIQTATSSGTAIAMVQAIADDVLPRSMKTEWTELLFMQIRAGNTAIYVFGLAVICVFLSLAALYESWALPLAVILVVPLCLLCSVVGVEYTNRPVDIFVQIGLIVLVGLACKNAILIVEFAKGLHTEGRPRFEATQEASRLRLRPILMTSLAFILGVAPLVFAEGAGAEMRRALGTAVFSGMLGVTLFGIFLTPVFFYVIQGLSETRFCAGPRFRWVGTIAMSTSLGLAIGFLVGRIGVLREPWSMIVGGIGGALVAPLILGIRSRIRPKSAAQVEEKGPTGGGPLS